MASSSTDTLSRYLGRIGLDAVAVLSMPRGTLEVLRLVVQAHARAVPFENVDVAFLGRPIQASYEHALQKIVEEKRGGFCFENNTGLSWLLRELGFDVFHTSARIFRPLHGFGPVNTHLTLIVAARFDETSKEAEKGFFLVDVGNGNSCSGPVLFSDGKYQSQGQDGCCYVLRRVPKDWLNAEGDYSHAASFEADAAGDKLPRGKWRLYEVVPTATMGLWSPTAACSASTGVVDGVPAGFNKRQGSSRAFFSALKEAGRTYTGSAAVTDGDDDVEALEVTENLLFELSPHLAAETSATLSDEPLSLFDFMCSFHQSNPASPFKNGFVCTKRLEGGGRLTVASGIWNGHAEDTGKTKQEWVLAKRAGPHAARETVAVVGFDALLAVLKESFGIALSEENERKVRDTKSSSSP